MTMAISLPLFFVFTLLAAAPPISVAVNVSDPSIPSPADVSISPDQSRSTSSLQSLAPPSNRSINLEPDPQQQSPPPPSPPQDPSTLAASSTKSSTSQLISPQHPCDRFLPPPPPPSGINFFTATSDQSRSSSSMRSLAPPPNRSTNLEPHPQQQQPPPPSTLPPPPPPSTLPPPSPSGFTFFVSTSTLKRFAYWYAFLLVFGLVGLWIAGKCLEAMSNHGDWDRDGEEEPREELEVTAGTEEFAKSLTEESELKQRLDQCAERFVATYSDSKKTD